MFIDFSKAFDCVNRELLLYKLLHMGIEGKIYFALKSLYENTQACVKINENLTPWFVTNNGVRQGDCLSPTLFSCFINDLATEIKALNIGIPDQESFINVMLYADDVVILSENKEDMQTMLNVVDNWCNTWE